MHFFPELPIRFRQYNDTPAKPFYRSGNNSKENLPQSFSFYRIRRESPRYTQHQLTIIGIVWLITLVVGATRPVLPAPLIQEVERLDFGTLAIPSNASVSRFTFPRSGTGISIEGQFVLIATGFNGRYRLTGFPASTPLSISFNDSTLRPGNIGLYEPLEIDNFDFVNVSTDSDGEAELVVGARLSSTGNGNGYVDAPYSGTTVLRVDYWQPDVNAFVFNTQTIDLEVELSSTLTISEEQPLSFGTLFARSSTTEQATLELSANGLYNISEPGDTRLVSLTTPSIGVLKVSGAAPGYSLSITPQSGDVLLEHTTNPAGSPHLILSALSSSPEGVGITDSNGELLISVGGMLSTELTALPTVYPSGQYEGTYQLTVSY